MNIYTDGSCLGNPGRGGGGFVVVENDKEIFHWNKGFANTTNNRMELIACVEALKQYGENGVTIYTDSQYVKNGIEKWIQNWKVNGWKTANKQEVKNKDLWEMLDALCSQHTVRWDWVRGHDGNVFNERADVLATTASQQGPWE